MGLGLSLLTQACKENASVPGTTEAAKTEMAWNTIEKTSETSGNPESNGASFNLKYPVLKGEQAYCDSVNQHITDFLLTFSAENLEESSQAKTLEEAADLFVQAHDKFVKEFPDAAGPWTLNGNATIEFEDADYITLGGTFDSFLGGAHPNYTVEYQSFFKKDGRKVSVENWVADLNSFLDQCEDAFRKANQIPADGDLMALGYYGFEEGFFVTDNFGILGDSVLFQYNAYEIAPYVMGAPSFKLAMKDIKKR